MLRRVEIVMGGTKMPGAVYDRNKFFINALSKYTEARCQYRPLSAEIFALLRSFNLRGSQFLWNRWARLTQPAEVNPGRINVGRYLLEFDSGTIKVAVDTADGRAVHDEDALQWCDVYFKCNHWPSLQYPDKVVPVVNANGMLSPQKIEDLKNYRDYPKQHDLIYWSRIWVAPGQQELNAGVEHNIRIFEALAKVDAKKNLLAVFPEDLSDEHLKICTERLDRAGVPWRKGWGDIDTKALWDAIASARINFLRPGNHLCISWRMMDLLCMGACVAVDGAPYAQWPVALRDGVNYVDCHATLLPEYELPEDDAYQAITEQVNALVKDHARTDAIARNNWLYFDQHASMEAIAAYIISVVHQRYPETMDMALV